MSTTCCLGVVTLVLSALTADVGANESEDEAVGAIERAGGEVVRMVGVAEAPVVGVRFSRSPLALGPLQMLPALPRLEWLTFSNVLLTDRHLQEIGGLSKLRSVALYHTAVTDAGL